MATRVFTGPSGIVVHHRGWKVSELNILADENLMRRGDTVDRAIQATIEAVPTWGPYVAPKDGRKLVPDDLLVGDHFALIISVRVATHGPEYAFPVQCDNTTCRTKFEWVIDLVNDLTPKPYPQASLEAFQRDNRLEGTIAGRRIVYRLMTGRMGRAVPTDKAKSMSVALAARIAEVDGVHPNDVTSWVEDMDAADAAELFALFRSSDGGVETTLDVQCHKCGNRMEVTLPFVKEFYIPRQRRTPGAKR